MTIAEDDERVAMLPLMTGENAALEDEAALWLAKSRVGVTALSEKRDYLTKDQLLLRYQKEVFNGTGVSDESLMSGMYRRAYNPLSGRRPRGTRNDEG